MTAGQNTFLKVQKTRWSLRQGGSKLEASRASLSDFMSSLANLGRPLKKKKNLEVQFSDRRLA